MVVAWLVGLSAHAQSIINTQDCAQEDILFACEGEENDWISTELAVDPPAEISRITYTLAHFTDCGALFRCDANLAHEVMVSLQTPSSGEPFEIHRRVIDPPEIAKGEDTRQLWITLPQVLTVKEGDQLFVSLRSNGTSGPGRECGAKDASLLCLETGDDCASSYGEPLWSTPEAVYDWQEGVTFAGGVVLGAGEVYSPPEACGDGYVSGGEICDVSAPMSAWDASCSACLVCLCTSYDLAGEEDYVGGGTFGDLDLPGAGTCIP